MAKKLYDALMSELEERLENNAVDLLSIEQGVKKNKDGIQEPFTRIEVEIPRGNGTFSRCRFSCKLPPIQLNVSEVGLEEGTSVILSGVKVTYVSAQKEIYMRADRIQVV